MVAKALTSQGTALGKSAKSSAEKAKKNSECSVSSIADDKGNEFLKHFEVDKIPFRPVLEAKLNELVNNIKLHEVKLCSDAAKEFVKLLKGETGGSLLRVYFENSPEFKELKEAWELRNDRKQRLSYIFKIIQTVLSHPEGKGTSTAIGRAINKFARFLIERKMEDIYNALNSNEGKQQNAALLLLASIVRRGPGIASEVAKIFDFKGFTRLGEYKTRKVTKHSTRSAFVAFALSFLEVGKPQLRRSVLQHKGIYIKVLQGLGKDDDDTVASVLSTFKDKILVKETSISHRLISVLFKSATLEQLARISAREDDGIVNELAHDVLLKVCTDPCNQLAHDVLLMLMKKLRPTEFCYHLDLLLAIVRGRPSFASAFLDEFPYNVEDLASPSWYSSISLAANLVSSVRTSCSFDFLNPDQRATPPSAGLDLQTIMKCICPRQFNRSLITKAMLHSDFLVKHGTLRFLLETLSLLDSLVTAWKLYSSHSCSAEQIQASLERDVMGEVRSFFPDSQVLLTVLKSLSGSNGTQKLSLKRKSVLDSELVDRKKRLKRSEKDVLEEEDGDIVIGGVISDKDIFLAEDPVDAQMTDQTDAEKECLGIVSEFCSKPIDSFEEAEMWFQIKLLEVLRIYVRYVPNGLEGSFDFFMKLLSSSSGFPAEFQRALLSLLNECICWTPKSQTERVPTKIPPLMFKYLHVLMSLLPCSSHDEVKDLAYNLALVAMSSTGAFDKNPSEIGAWFRFLPGFDKIERPLKVQEAVRSMSSVVISFLCNAVSTVGNYLFEQWGIVRSSLSHFKGVSIGFSPLTVCILEKCVRLLNSDKKTLPEKTEISLYVCSTLKYLLQTQVDSRPLSCLVQSVLSEVFHGSKDSLCEWRPLRILLLFSQSLSDKKPFILHSRRTECLLAGTFSIADTLDEIKGLVRSISPDQDEFAGIAKAFPSALICATPESILKNFASVMAVSWNLYETSFSFLHSIFFLDDNFLGNLLKLSPDLFVRGSEVTGSRNLRDVTVDSKIDLADHSSITEELRSKTAFFLEQMPFPALLNAIMRMDISCLREFPRISELLKVLRPKSDSIESDIQLILNWLVISEIDQDKLDILVSTCEHFLFDERHIVQKGDLRENKSIMAIKDLVERLLLVFRGKFELCVGSQSYAPLLQPLKLIHDLLRLISPVKLFYLARSILSKIDEKELARLTKKKKKLASLGLDIAGGAFEMLMLYSHQPAAKRGIYDLLWELEENNCDSNLIEEVYSLACRFSTALGLKSADNCLLKVWAGIFRGKHSVHPLTVIISQIVGRTPKDLIIHCINQANKTKAKTRAKILFYLVESSPLHLSVFGHHFFSKQCDHCALKVDQFIMLLPAVMLYLASVSAKLEKPCSRYLDITVYSNILMNGFLQWPKFSSRGIFKENYEEIFLSTTEDIDTMFDASLLGKAVRMFQYHLTESPTKTNDLLKVLNSMFPADKEMLDYKIEEVEVQPVHHILNVAIRVVAKVELSRICLFHEGSSMCETISCVNATSSEMGSNRETLLKRLLNALVNTWQCVVKLADDSFKRISKAEQEKYWFLCKSLENFISRSILKFLEDVCEELVHLDSLPFLEKLMKSVLRYRFEDSKTLKMLTEIFSLLSRGKYSYAPYIQLLISHSQFTPTISSLSISSSHTGGPVSSILKHLIMSSPNSVGVGSCCLEAPDYVKQLEIVKTLRVLLSKCGKDSGINLKELHFLLLCSYGATLSEIDLELYKLMHDIELIDDENRLNVPESDNLWGKAALKIRERLRFSQDASDVGEADLVEEIRQSLDPKICALTVLHFPNQRTAEVSENSYLDNDPISKKCSHVIERYDPAFILRFSVHSLSMGYIEPVEFASLGLLAVAFVSMSSADLGMRKLSHDTLGIFVKALESCTMKEHVHIVKRLRLLLLYVKHGVEEQYQRIPTVSAVFAAEASLTLLDSSHEHYFPILNLLTSSSPPDLKGIPLFHDFFSRSAVGSQRLWELRLVCVGLKSEDDAKIYIRNSVLEKVMNFFSSPLADDETKRLILQVVRKSVKFDEMARHLVENCDLLSWCSSCISVFTTKPIGDEDSRLVVVLQVITDALASKDVTEWLQRFALEGLMEISSRLYRLLSGGLVSIRENGSSVDLILQILSATLKISQKREMYQPHFTITIEGIFQIFEAGASCNSPQFEASAERRLDTILMSTPPIDIICMDVDKLRRFLMWGTSTALKSDLRKRSKPSESHQDTKICTEERQDETMVAKFLRWLLASVILGKLYSEANDSDSTVLSETKPETLLSLLEYLKKRNLGGSMTKSEHVIGEVIIHLQKLPCTDYGALLPSVVFALSLMLLHCGLETAGTESEGDYKLIKSLCSRIRIPPEAIPAWRWSYDQAWKNFSSEPATVLEKMDVHHACQHLLLIFSDMLGETPRGYQFRESFDMSSMFEWERGLVET